MGDFRGIAKTSILASARDGNQFAQYSMGLIYIFEQGETQNYERAAYWLRKSAEANYSEAQDWLSKLYVLGLGVRRDFAEAIRLRRLAAQQGNVQAQYGLGTLYQSGYGTEKDFVLAYMWYDIASRNVDMNLQGTVKDARELREMIAKKLTPEQISKAKDLSASCTGKNLQSCN